MINSPPNPESRGVPAMPSQVEGFGSVYQEHLRAHHLIALEAVVASAALFGPVDPVGPVGPVGP